MADSPRTPSATADPILLAEDLRKVYGTVAPTVALDGASFALQSGEFAAIVGQSGSGKSTLLNLIGLLDTPSSGRVLLDGRDANTAGRTGRARLRNELIGFVFQFHYLLPEFTVWENVTMPALIAGKRVDSALRQAAEEALDLLGLDGLEGKNANALSGGQKQRVAIARALTNSPRLILADEPTGNLDTANSAAVYELFRRINERYGTAFLIVTHDRGIARQTDRIIEVLDGRIVADEPNAYGMPSREAREALAGESP